MYPIETRLLQKTDPREWRQGWAATTLLLWGLSAAVVLTTTVNVLEWLFLTSYSQLDPSEH